MNIFHASKTFGRFTLHFEFVGAFALGVGLNAYPRVLAFGVSLGPLVISLAYAQDAPGATSPLCVGGACQTS